MKVYVIRSYVGESLDLSGIKIRPWFYTEVPVETVTEDQKRAINEAKLLRRVTVALVVDGNPVDQMNEAVVLQGDQK